MTVGIQLFIYLCYKKILEQIAQMEANMKQKKNKGLRITIVILLIMILLLVGGIAYLYFFTDMFKSNKQLFFKYTSQIVQSEDGFITNQLVQYFQKKNSTSYENNGEITFEVSIPNMEDDLKLANNFNITFSGKEDPTNSKSEKEISLNYSDSVKFPLTYKRTNNITGIQTQYIGSSFVAVRNDEEISGLEDINNLLKLQKLEFSNEELRNLKTTYFDNILNTLDDSKFSTLTEGNLTGYRLTLTGEELKNIVVQILNALKADANTTHKLNEILQGVGIDTQLNENSIDDLIENMNDLKLNDDIEMTVYATGGNLSRVDVGMAGNTVTMNREGNNQEITYTISLNTAEQETSAIFTAKYSGLNSDNVTETYELTLDGTYEEGSIEKQTETSENTTSHNKYSITNNVQFKDSVEIDDLTEENAVILNDKDNSYVNNLMNAIQERIVEVNRVQMEELGVSEGENPIQYLIPTLFVTNQATAEVDEQAVNAFNAKFELYQSTNTKGATVKGLLTTIQNNNETEGNSKIEEINMDGEEYEVTEQNITLLKSSINVDDAYRVEFEKDINTGLIYRAVINKR